MAYTFKDIEDVLNSLNADQKVQNEIEKIKNINEKDKIVEIANIVCKNIQLFVRKLLFNSEKLLSEYDLYTGDEKIAHINLVYIRLQISPEVLLL